MSGAYEKARERLEILEAAFYGTLQAADDYAALMAELAAAETARPAHNAELVRRFGHQKREAAELVAALEGAPLEALLRLLDRVLMIKATEEGRFV